MTDDYLIKLSTAEIQSISLADLKLLIKKFGSISTWTKEQIDAVVKQLKQVSEEIVYNSPFNMKMSVITFY
jgi:hypothetical protein